MKAMQIGLGLLALLGVLAGCRRSSNSSTNELAVRIETRGGQSAFQIGEVIRLDLSFTSTRSNKYHLEMATFDREQQFQMETFDVAPQSGWDDPLAKYFHSCDIISHGGLMGYELLSTEPIVISLELNEWVRFLQPGQYRIRARSKRVFQPTSPPGAPAQQYELLSNELLLTIVSAKQDWQRKTLEHAMEALGPGGEPYSRPYSRTTPPDPRWEAAKTLRYLGTPAAAREMAHRFAWFPNADVNGDLSLGLMGSPAREAALDALKALLVDPKYPVTSDFLFIMAVVALPPETKTDLRARRAELEDQFRQDLKAILGTKEGQARQVSAFAISHPLL